MISQQMLRFAVVSLAAISNACWAQFAGDVFFKNPSVVAEEGSTAELEILTFTGSEPLGAVHLDLVYDPALLEVVSVNPGTAAELGAEGLVTKNQDDSGTLSLVALNSASLAEPFGTVSFAKVVVRPLVPAGETVPVSLQVNELLDTQSSSFGTQQGFGGEISVTSPSNPSPAVRSFAASMITVEVAEDLQHQQRATAMGRPGQRLQLMDLEQVGGGFTVVPREVLIVPVFMPSD